MAGSLAISEIMLLLPAAMAIMLDSRLGPVLVRWTPVFHNAVWGQPPRLPGGGIGLELCPSARLIRSDADVRSAYWAFPGTLTPSLASWSSRERSSQTSSNARCEF